jgi:hypothetical protein
MATDAIGRATGRSQVDCITDQRKGGVSSFCSTGVFVGLTAEKKPVEDDDTPPVGVVV